MWTYLTPWIVQDNQLPPIAIGTHLSGVGLSVIGELTDMPAAPGDTPAVSEVPNRGTISAGYVHTVTGVAGGARDVHVQPPVTEAGAGAGVGAREFLYTEFVLDCGWSRLRAVCSEPVADQIRAGDVVSVRGIFAVLPEIAGGADIAEFVQDWTVRRIQVEQYTVLWREMQGEGAGREGTQGDIVALHEIDHIDSRSDHEMYETHPAHDASTSTSFAYVLDLLHRPTA